MITISRLLCRQLHTVFRRALNISTRGPGTSVVFCAGADGLSIRAQSHDGAVEYHLPGAHQKETLVAPLELLSDCKGAKQDDVSLEPASDGQVVASWNDGIPQIVQYSPPGPRGRTKFPSVPEKLVHAPPSLVPALHDAMETADPDAIRYAMNHIQLDGKGDRIVATDGRQVLVQTGIEFPWDTEILIPRRTVFACKELAADEPVFIGKTDDWATIRVRPWTIHLRIEKEGRFPDVTDYIPQYDSAVASCRISDRDAEFLVKAVKRLPSEDDLNLRVTVDLPGDADGSADNSSDGVKRPLTIRAKSENQSQVMELVLRNSDCTGEAIRFNTDRTYLARACQFGLRTLNVFGSDKPVLCQDENRSFVWALLSANGVLKPTKDAIQIASETHVNQTTTNRATRADVKPTNRKSKSRTNTMTKQTNGASTKSNPRNGKPQNNNSQNGKSPNGNAKTNGNAIDEAVGVDNVIEIAEELKTSLRDSLAKTNELISGLRRHKKTTKTVQSALASLRQL